VHERHRRSGRVDGRAQGGDVGQRLATERSTEVAEEDHQCRPIAGQRFQPRAARIGNRSHPTPQFTCVEHSLCPNRHTLVPVLHESAD
jgi:hypothetical protein